MSKTLPAADKAAGRVEMSFDVPAPAATSGILTPAKEISMTHQQAVEQLLDSYEQYRRTVAYEIHDGVVQCLTAALMSLESSLQILGEQVPAAAQEGLDRTRQLLREGLTEARGLMSGLRPLLLDDFGLIAAVDHLVRESRKNTRANIEWSHQGEFERLAPPLENILFRIVQEGLGNALRHSGSDKVHVMLAAESGRIRVSIEDWGCGFEPGNVAQSRFGLQGICERAKLFGGRTVIDSAPGRGTRVVVELPFVRIAALG